MIQTRWNHLSDVELSGYKNLITGDQDPTIVEELFNRLEKKIKEDRDRADKVNDAEAATTGDGYLL